MGQAHNQFLSSNSTKQSNRWPARAGLFIALGMMMVFATPSTGLNAAEPGGPETLITPEDALEYQLIDKIQSTITGKTPYDKEIQDGLKAFYLEHGRKTVWLNEKGLTPKAEKTLAEIKQGRKYGLNVTDIKIPPMSLIKGAPEERADAELMLSRAFISYAQRAKGGNLVPQKISRYLDNSPEYPNPEEVLKNIVKADDPAKALLAYHPKHPQFWALKKRLDKLRAERGEAKPLVKIPPGRLLRPYDRDPRVALLRERLEVPVPEKNGKPLYPEDIYDSALVKAVQNFQAASGLRRTGVINRTTRDKLNNNDKPDVEKKILANMERWRWMPNEFGSTHIRVNIPEFLARFTRDNKVVHTERVITGKRSQKTPSFSDEMETVVFNPYWNVPQSIIWNEMGGVAPRGYESRYVNGRVFIRQPPGPRNALGQIKFLFPNKHSVYLHDTPTKNLFNKKVRAFSHGCMRLRDPLKMAEFILENEQIDRKEINRRIRSRRNQRVELNTKIPTHVTYFTMWSNNDGTVSHFNDIYGHDKRVIAALEGRPMGLEPRKRINRQPLSVVQQRKKKPVGPSFFGLFFN